MVHRYACICCQMPLEIQTFLLHLFIYLPKCLISLSYFWWNVLHLSWSMLTGWWWTLMTLCQSDGTFNQWLKKGELSLESRTSFHLFLSTSLIPYQKHPSFWQFPGQGCGLPPDLPACSLYDATRPQCVWVRMDRPVSEPVPAPETRSCERQVILAGPGPRPVSSWRRWRLWHSAVDSDTVLPLDSHKDETKVAGSEIKEEQEALLVTVGTEKETNKVKQKNRVYIQVHLTDTCMIPV